MKESEIKTLVVGPEDVLFVVFSGDATMENIRAMGDSIFKTRPELKGRVFMMSNDDIQLAVIKKSEVKND